MWYLDAVGFCELGFVLDATGPTASILRVDRAPRGLVEGNYFLQTVWLTATISSRPLSEGSLWPDGLGGISVKKSAFAVHMCKARQGSSTASHHAIPIDD